MDPTAGPCSDRALRGHRGSSRLQHKAAPGAVHRQRHTDGSGCGRLSHLQGENEKTPRAGSLGVARPTMASSEQNYSAGVADTGDKSSTRTATGSSRRTKRRKAIRTSRKRRTQAFGLPKCEANSRFVSRGTQYCGAMLEHRDQFVGLLWLDRQHCASAERVDRHPSHPVKLEAMTAGDVAQPAMRIFEIVRLEAQRRNHRRYVQITNRLPGRVSELDVSHEISIRLNSQPGPERSGVGQDSSGSCTRDRLFYAATASISLGTCGVTPRGLVAHESSGQAPSRLISARGGDKRENVQGRRRKGSPFSSR